MKNANFKFIKLFSIIAVSAFFFACKSAPVELTDDLTFAQLIQRGQDAVSLADYKAADQYFVACLDRYGESLKCYVEARYELATSNLKQKKYDMAKTMFNEILTIFDKPEAMYQVQPKFKKLAKIQLEKIEKIEAEKAAKEAKSKK